MSKQTEVLSEYYYIETTNASDKTVYLNTFKKNPKTNDISFSITPHKENIFTTISLKSAFSIANDINGRVIKVTITRTQTESHIININNNI